MLTAMLSSSTGQDVVCTALTMELVIASSVRISCSMARGRHAVPSHRSAGQSAMGQGKDLF